MLSTQFLKVSLCSLGIDGIIYCFGQLQVFLQNPKGLLHQDAMDPTSSTH